MVWISISEIISNVGHNLTQKPELAINHNPVNKKTDDAIDVNYITRTIGSRVFRIIYDRNERDCTRLRALYNSPRFRATTTVPVTINGQQFIGIKFSNANISGYIQVYHTRRIFSFLFTQHNMRDGIWVPKPAFVVGRRYGLIGPHGEVILANGQVPELSRNNGSFFIPGGANYS